MDNLQTAAKIALGRRLFFDTRLSRNGSVSCATCHQPSHAFADERAVAQGIDKQRGTRNTPSLLNVSFNSTQFWDGRRPSLEAQALDPLTNPLEHGLNDEEDLLSRIRTDRRYLKSFARVFRVDRASIRGKHVAQALASFERTLIAGDSPFDRFLFGHDARALSPGAQRGLGLFRGPALCSTCHIIGQNGATFTDNDFHSANIGLQRIAPMLADLTTQWATGSPSATSLGQVILSHQDIAALGRFVITLKPADIGKFRTPSLRNVALTAPYMHDGSVATLAEALERELYVRSSQESRPLVLTPCERADLVEFLMALTSSAAVSRDLHPDDHGGALCHR
jgi:cytochrome c peroxidase